MTFYKRNIFDKKLQIDQGNTRIDFGSLIFEASKQQDTEGLEMILSQNGALRYINDAGRDGMTPLTTAAKNGDIVCVKILLANKCDLYLKGNFNGIEKYAWEIANEFGHTRIASYLNGCVDDLLKYPYHRAMMEADVLEICRSKKLHQNDLREFDKHMERLTKTDTFCVDGDQYMPSLLIQSAIADNQLIVDRLLEKYGATPYSNNEHGETALHIACRNMSDLRYYLTKKTPELLFAVNTEGVQPLHIACEKNDLNYFTWIFQSVLEDINREEASKYVCIDPQFSLSFPQHSLSKKLVSQFSQPDFSSGPRSLTRNNHAFDIDGISEYPDGPQALVEMVSYASIGTTSSHQPIPFVLNVVSSQDDDDDDTISCSLTPTVVSETDSTQEHSITTLRRPYLGLCRANVEESFLFSASTLLESTSSILKQACSNYGDSPLTMQNLLTLHMRLFAININGRSVLHMASNHGFTEILHLILQVAKVLEHNPDGADLNILIRRDTSITPIEEAIHSCQPACLRLLLDFASTTPIIKTILDDSTLFTKAVTAGDKKTLEILIEFGLFKGLNLAIHEAVNSNMKDILRMLMFYYTQIVCLLQSSHVKQNKVICMEKALVAWEQLQLIDIDPVWFVDAKIAVTSVSHSLKSGKYFHPVQENRELFLNLGDVCTEYFRVHVWQPHALPKAWKPFFITNLNLSGNQLQSIPPELFQIDSLKTLDLSQNKLHGLPSSLDFENPLYTCKKLTKLQVSSNNLQTLPEDLFFAFGDTLVELHANDNQIDTLPPGLWICPNLHTLALAQNKLKQLHYFSNKRYFYDEEFSRLLIDSIQFERNIPVNTGKIDDEEFMNLMNYVTRLNVFYQTVEALLPGVIDQDSKKNTSLLQHVIDIHWLRSRLNSDRRSTTRMHYFDISLPLDENCKLRTLDLSRNNFTVFPWDLACIAPNLEKLDLRNNKITTINIIKDLPSCIESVILSDNCITSVSEKHAIYPCGSPVKLLSGYLTDPTLVGHCKHTEHVILHKATNMNLNNNSLVEFPCARKATNSKLSLERMKSLDSCMFQSFFPSLSVLSLNQNNLQAVPEGVQYLTQLSSLSLSHNISISKLPPEMGIMNPQTLLVIKLEGVYPKNINQRLLESPGARGILTYLKMLRQKSIPYHRLKLMIIGNSNVGKTSLLLNLTQKGKVTRFKEVEKGVNKIPLSTVGVDLGDWEYQLSKKPKVTFMTWDFGGQEEYYATHQCFLTQRSLYVLVWNVEMKEAGLESLRPWLENIGGRVPGAPVVIVGTHIDSIPLQKRPEILKHFTSIFHKMYLDKHTKAYPNIHRKCFFVSSNDGTNISHFRDELYEFALSIKPPGRRHNNFDSLLKQHIPESYLKLQDTIREVARQYAKERRHPVLTTEQIRLVASNGTFNGNSDELEQGIQFLHANGILLHYDDPALSDVYFIDPQWLCSMLACVVTIHEKNSFQKNGFMEVSALKLLLHDDKFPHSLIKEFVSLMQKFEVVHLLDENRLLIPSLLPSNEGDACIVLPTLLGSIDDKKSIKAKAISKQSFSRHTTQVFARYYLLPFIPNGFFPRVLARILGSEISECFTQCVTGQDTHWRCWRNGIILVDDQTEIIHVSPVHLPLANTDETVLLSSTESNQICNKDQSMIQIIVSILPEFIVKGKSPLLPCDSSRSTSSHLAIWILRILIDILDSVFDDWYDAFARKNGLDLVTVQQACPCSKCLHQTAVHSRGRTETFFSTLTSQLSSYVSSQRTLYMFTSPFCVLSASTNTCLPCPVHGPIPVSDVAPDLAFADFATGKLFYEPESTVKRLQSLGTGGFGSVHCGIIEYKNEQKKVAIKEFHGITGMLESEGKEAFVWDIYLSGSKEARMMNYLCHRNILELVGLAFNPLRLLLELAPKGDLKSCMKPFKSSHVKVNKRILKILMFQVADAMEYIHSKKIIYRDLKPGNILVWEFPDPKTQWTEDASVFIKIADYGISKYCTPEGVRGSDGTPAYLPPEVVLHGGSASFSTMLDVYSFGMLMYYLFTFLGPFENDKGRPVSALLDEQKRPELTFENRPPALQMYELMCWCWSEKPNSRPTFPQIKEIIKDSMFTYLFGASPLTTNNDNFTAICTHTYTQPANYTQQHQPHDESLVSPSPSVVSMLAASIIEDNNTRVWYGTEKGTLGYVQFMSSETTSEVAMNIKCPVTSLCVCTMQLWVGTAGKGIQVYDALNHKTMIAVWNQSEVICKLLLVKQSGYVFGLTTKGLVIFDTSFTKLETVKLIQPMNSYLAEPILTFGVVVPPKDEHDAEVWCCSSTGRLKIFNGCDSRLHGTKQLQISKAEHYEMYHFEEDDQNKVIISMGNLIQIWNASTHKPEGTTIHDCHKACYQIYGINVSKSLVTSLLVVNNKIYIGTRGGLIIIFNHHTQEVDHLLKPYNSSVSFLIPISKHNYLRKFSKLSSRRDSVLFSTSKSLSSSSIEGTLTNSGDGLTSECTLVLSFGKEYHGIIRNIKNYPQSFLLPSDNSLSCSFCLSSSRTNCLCSNDCRNRTKPAKPDHKTSYMLYWLDNELSS